MSWPCKMDSLSREFSVFWREEETLGQEDNREQEEEELREEENREQKKRRERWKPSEMKIFMECLMLIKRKKMAELEEVYAKKHSQKKGKGKQARIQLMADFDEYFPDYLQFRRDWIARNPDLAFEDITDIRAMMYTNKAVPGYVYNGRSNSLQIYSAKIEVETSLKWPLHVFGVVAVRDSIDSQRNIIFNRARGDCQTLTEQNPWLLLTGPTRAVVMNEPVTIEAELKVKGDVRSKDEYFIIGARKLPLLDGRGMIEFTGARSTMRILAAELGTCVEATIFLRVIEGTWPAGLRGYFAASTACVPKEILLIEVGGEGNSVRGDGSMKHLRHVVSVEDSGTLIVSFKVWAGDGEVLEEKVLFEAKLSGRSFGSLKVHSCCVGVLVAWSRIHPRCEELVSDEEMRLCHF